MSIKINSNGMQSAELEKVNKIMAQKIEILVEVDPQGRGAAGIKNITVNLDQLERKSNQAGSTGREALDGFAGGLGIPTSIGAATAAIAAGIVLVTRESIIASNTFQRANRVLRSDTQEAGLEFARTSKAAEKFGDDLNITLQDSARAYGQFLRVVKAAGELDDLDKLTQRFKDLTKAYGLTGREVEVLTGQLLSGQDEALNRLGISDPSQLYKTYADNVNKTVEALTDEEKVRARLLAVTDKGARFSGAAAEFATTTAGQWERVGKNISDATTKLGEYLNKYTLVGSLPGLLNAQIEVTSGGGNETVFDIYARQLREKGEAQTQMFREQAVKDSDAYFKKMNESLNVPEALENPYKNFGALTTIFGAEQAGKIREGFVNQYTELFKDKKLNEVTAIFAEEQFNEIKGIFDRDKRIEIQDQFTKFWDDFSKSARSNLREVRGEAEKTFGTFADRFDGDKNPFTKVLVEARNNAEKLRDTFGVLGDRTVRELQKIEDAFTRQKLLALELDAQLKANQLRREADNLANFTGLSGAEQRSLDVIGSQIERAVSSPALLAVANALARGAVGSQKISSEEYLQRNFALNAGRSFDSLTEEEKYLALKGREKEIEQLNKKDLFFSSGINTSGDDTSREAIDNLLDVQLSLVRERGEFGIKAGEAVNKALVNLFNSLSPDMQAAIAQGEEGFGVRRAFEDAFRDGAESLQRSVIEEIEKARVADKAIAGVKEDIATIEKLRAEGLSTSEADARLLATTGALDASELTADVRQARIDALRREADRQVKAQEDATNAVEEAREATDRLTAAVDKLAEDIRKPENRRLLVEITNNAKANVRDELYGSL